MNNLLRLSLVTALGIVAFATHTRADLASSFSPANALAQVQPADEPDHDSLDSGKGKDDEAKKAATPRRPKTPGVTRVAILNFGPPSDWQGSAGNMVGTVINAAAWEKAIPLLEKDGVEVVVVRINSGGGLTLELPRFNKVFEEKYKPKFRTVGWVESAISCAAMSPYVLREFYFMPEGNFGACTEWSGDLVASKDNRLSDVLFYMEKTSALAGRDPKIMRAMQIQEPLSADIDEAGNVTFHQNTSGKYLINPEKRVLTLNAVNAAQIKFSLGTAATKEELAKAMGLGEVEWGGKEASDFIDRNMRENDKGEKRFATIYQKYTLCVEGAGKVQAGRQAEVGVAKRYLEEMRQISKLNENIALMAGTSPEWFRKQDALLKDLLKKAK